MYHTIIRRKLRQSFDAVNTGNYAAIVRQFDPRQVNHWFSGAHALSGGRDKLDDIQGWYDRLAILMPDLKFAIKKIIVSGWPWNTTAAVEWVDHFTDREGQAYANQGVHIIRIRWGKITELHIYCDTQQLAAICARLESQEVREAAQAPIGGAGLQYK